MDEEKVRMGVREEVRMRVKMGGVREGTMISTIGRFRHVQAKNDFYLNQNEFKI